MSGGRGTKGRLLALACALIGLLAIPATSSAATRYAAFNGVGPAATCPQSNPCSLDDAVEAPAVTDGDRVVLATGTYTLSSPLEIDDGISVGGAPQAVPTIVGSISPLPAIAVDATGAELHDLTVAQLGPAAAVQVTRGTVERVLASSDGPVACGLGATGGNLSLIRDSACWSRPAASGGSAIAVTQSAAAARAGTLRNVTAWASGTGGTAIDLSASGGGSASVDALNVIASGTADDISADAAVGATATASLTTSNFADVTPTGAGTTIITSPAANANQTDPPLLKAPDSGDFDQRAGSPTLDSGSLGSLLGDEDLGGEDRIQGPAIDIGADERDGTPPRTTIVSGPAAAVTTGKVTFAFRADEADSTFECRIDDDQFHACTSPWTSDSLIQGDHVFEVRATDRAGNVETNPPMRFFSVDKVIAGANAAAARTQRPSGRSVTLAVTVKADELARVRAAGTVHAGHKSFRFESGQVTLVAGTPHRLVLRPTEAKASRKILKALKKGKDVEARLTATFTDLLGNKATSGEITVRVKGTKGGKGGRG